MAGKLQAQVLDCLTKIEAHHMEIDGWRPSSRAFPYLYTLYRKDGRVEGKNLNLPEWVWKASPNLVKWLLKTGRNLDTEWGRRLVNVYQDAIGFALVVEAWALSEKDEAEVEKIARARKIHLHRHRRENRMVCGVLFMGANIYTVTRFRKNHEIVTFPGEDDNVQLAGDIPRALRMMADAWLSVQASQGVHN